MSVRKAGFDWIIIIIIINIIVIIINNFIFFTIIIIRMFTNFLVANMYTNMYVNISQMSADSFRVNVQECSRSLYAFIAFRPTCFARRSVMLNLHETSTHRARELHPDSKNNSRRITYGILCAWGMLSLSPLSSLAQSPFGLEQ